MKFFKDLLFKKKKWCLKLRDRKKENLLSANSLPKCFPQLGLNQPEAGAENLNPDPCLAFRGQNIPALTGCLPWQQIEIEAGVTVKLGLEPRHSMIGDAGVPSSVGPAAPNVRLPLKKKFVCLFVCFWMFGCFHFVDSLKFLTEKAIGLSTRC